MDCFSSYSSVSFSLSLSSPPPSLSLSVSLPSSLLFSYRPIFTPVPISFSFAQRLLVLSLDVDFLTEMCGIDKTRRPASPVLLRFQNSLTLSVFPSMSPGARLHLSRSLPYISLMFLRRWRPSCPTTAFQIIRCLTLKAGHF